MGKFHINGKGVPAPCNAKQGKCPLGGEGEHYASKEEAKIAIDKANEKEHGILPGVTPSMTDKDITKKGRELTDLISKRKNSVKPPELDKEGIKSIDDLYTMVELKGAFITRQEHDPIKNVKEMFDHVANKSGKLYRYDDHENPYLETYDYDFDGEMRRHKQFLDDDGLLEEYEEEGFKETFGSTTEEAFKADVQNHRRLHDYSREIAVEYGKDFEKKVYLSGDYNQEEQDKLQDEYRQAVSDKIGVYIEAYGEDDDDWD